jgi:hypothetical protein
VVSTDSTRREPVDPADELLSRTEAAGLTAIQALAALAPLSALFGIVAFQVKTRDAQAD